MFVTDKDKEQIEKFVAKVFETNDPHYTCINFPELIPDLFKDAAMKMVEASLAFGDLLEEVAEQLQAQGL